MGGFFTVGALAIAAERANAVGAVRLTCTWDALEIELVRGAGYAIGFAPGAVAEAVTFQVPYTAVRGLVRQGRTLCLALDPTVATPHNRFALTLFSDDPSEALASAYRARQWARVAAAALPVPFGLLAMALSPSWLVSGALGTCSLGVLVALSVWFALREIARLATWGGPVSDRYRDAFEVELSRRLGLLPARMTVDAPFEAPPLAEIVEATPQSRAPLAIAAATLVVVGTALFLKTYAVPESGAGGPAPSETGAALELEAGAFGRSARSARAVGDEARAGFARCVCARADSPLWKDGVPALSVLPSSRRGDGEPVSPVVDARGVPKYDFDLAVVNNASSPLHDLRIVLTFMRRKEGRPVGVTDRGLFWEGDLVGGRSVKWRVRAPGSEMRIDPSVTTLLGEDGLDSAPADAFFALASAKLRVVREHAAAMLAYLRDPRAREVLDALGVGMPAEARTLSRIARATESRFACDLVVKDQGLEACIFNGSSEPAGHLALEEVLEGGAVGRRFPIEGTLPVHEGARFRFTLGAAPPPAEVHVVEREQ